MAKMTLWGIETYLNSINESFLDLLTLPTGMVKADLLNAILLDGGEFGVVYQDPDFLREAVGAWSKKYADTFAKWWEVWTIKYNPLHNYDRTERITDSGSKVETAKGVNNRLNNEINLTATNSETKGEDKLDVSAYDETSAYSPKEKRENGIGAEAGGSDTKSNSEREKSDETRVDSSNNIHVGRMFGNIGTTRTQEMAIDENSFRKDYNPYKLITDLFVVDFLIPIY